MNPYALMAIAMFVVAGLVAALITMRGNQDPQETWRWALDGWGIVLSEKALPIHGIPDVYFLDQEEEWRPPEERPILSMPLKNFLRYLENGGIEPRYIVCQIRYYSDDPREFPIGIRGPRRWKTTHFDCGDESHPGIARIEDHSGRQVQFQMDRVVMVYELAQRVLILIEKYDSAREADAKAPKENRDWKALQN
jgi:hypothetical protein